jgi:WD40 repeat protein
MFFEHRVPNLVRACKFAPDGKTVTVSASEDKTLKIWNVA